MSRYKKINATKAFLANLLIITLIFIISNSNWKRTYFFTELGEYKVYNCRFLKGQMINKIEPVARIALISRLWPTKKISFKIGATDEDLIFNNHHYQNAEKMPNRFSRHDPGQIYSKSDGLTADWGQSKGMPEEDITIPIYEDVDKEHFKVIKNYYIKPSNETIFAKFNEVDYKKADFSDPYYEYKLRSDDSYGECETYIDHN